MHLKLQSLVALLDEISQGLGKLENWGHQSDVEKAKAIAVDVLGGLQAAGVKPEVVGEVAAVGEIVESALAATESAPSEPVEPTNPQ